MCSGGDAACLTYQRANDATSSNYRTGDADLARCDTAGDDKYPGRHDPWNGCR
jgi:hypothetical protein